MRVAQRYGAMSCNMSCKGAITRAWLCCVKASTEVSFRSKHNNTANASDRIGLLTQHDEPLILRECSRKRIVFKTF